MHAASFGHLAKRNSTISAILAYASGSDQDLLLAIGDGLDAIELRLRPQVDGTVGHGIRGERAFLHLVAGQVCELLAGRDHRGHAFLALQIDLAVAVEAARRSNCRRRVPASAPCRCGRRGNWRCPCRTPCTAHRRPGAATACAALPCLTSRRRGSSVTSPCAVDADRQQARRVVAAC